MEPGFASCQDLGAPELMNGTAHNVTIRTEALEKLTRLYCYNTDFEEIESSDDDELTLVTCYPFYYVGDAPQRYIVHAKKLSVETHASLRD